MGFNSDVLKMIDLPHAFQEVVNFAPGTSAAGVCIDGDDDRYIYMLFSITAFWRYDTWTNSVQQLANPTGTFGAGTCIRYTKKFGSQLNGVVYGSVYAIVSSGTGAATFQRYDIATNLWTTLNVTGFAATFGTDGCLLYPSPALNGEATFHSLVMKTITVTAAASLNATSISVSALPQALIIGTVLNFGTWDIPKYAVLTAAAALNATSITVSPLTVALTGTEAALYYDNMYVIGNATTQMYRFSISTATWSTTSANSGTPALAAIPAAVGAGCGLRFVPGVVGYESKFVCIRGANSNNIYAYDLVANTWATVTYNPNTEVLTTGTCSGVAVNTTTGKADKLLISSSNFQNSNVRILQLDLISGRMNPISSLVIYPTGVAVVGDKLTIMESPDGLQVMYQLLHTSNALVRDASLSLIS